MALCGILPLIICASLLSIFSLSLQIPVPPVTYKAIIDTSISPIIDLIKIQKLCFETFLDADDYDLSDESSTEWITNLGRDLSSTYFRGFVAITGDDLIGYSEIKFQQANQLALIENLCVDSRCRKLGIGRELVRLCVEYAKESWKAHDIRINLEDDNVEAMAFYTKLGFEIIPGITSLFVAYYRGM